MGWPPWGVIIVNKFIISGRFLEGIVENERAEEYNQGENESDSARLIHK
jgi:hypothetical protein